MKKFEELDPRVIKQPAFTLFRKLGKEIKEISFLGRGEGSAVFKITTLNRNYCLKTALFPERKNKILNEARIRKYFIEKGLRCVPAPYYADQEFFENGAVLFDYVEGTHSNYKDESTIKKIAYHSAEIHKVDYKISPNGFEQIKRNYHALKETINTIETKYPHLVNSTISQAFSFALEEYKITLHSNQDVFSFGISGLLHGDLEGHFLTDKQGNIWLVDWENSEYGDILEEISSFIFFSGISNKMRTLYFREYKTHFSAVSELDMEKIGYFYIFPIPVFNLCWGLDQLNINLIHNLDPERKLRDIEESAKNLGTNFTKKTTSLMVKGVDELRIKLIEEYELKV